MSKKLVKISKNMRFLSTFFATTCANCSKFVLRISYVVLRIGESGKFKRERN